MTLDLIGTVGARGATGSMGALRADPVSPLARPSAAWGDVGMASPEMRAGFEAAMGRAEAAVDAPPPSGDDAAMVRAGLDDGAGASARARSDVDLEQQPVDDKALPVVVPLMAVPPAMVSAADMPVAIAPVLAPSATAAAAQRLMAAPAIDRSAPWRIDFGAREAAASGVAGLVIAPAAHGAAALRVIPTSGLQAALSVRVDALRTRLAERGIKTGEIAVSGQEGDDEFEG